MTQSENPREGVTRLFRARSVIADLIASRGRHFRSACMALRSAAPRITAEGLRYARGHHSPHCICSLDRQPATNDKTRARDAKPSVGRFTMLNAMERDACRGRRSRNEMEI